MCSLEAELFKVLGVSTRLRIIELLKEKGALGAKEISEVLGITVSAASQHLKVLKHAGLVCSERKGYWIPYEIKLEALEQCGEILGKVCKCGCKGPNRWREAGRDGDEDKMAALRQSERELQRDLAEVQRKIQDLEKK
jgi:DNA-binding transcriptional ArsR family regulator